MNDKKMQTRKAVAPVKSLLAALAIATLGVLPAIAWDLPFHGKETLTGDSRLNREINRERSYQRNNSKVRFICEQIRSQRRINRSERR